MKRNARLMKTVLLASAGVCTTLAGSVAMATDGFHCKRIRGTANLPVFQLPCERDPAYFACQLGTLEGTLDAKWDVYFEQPGTVINEMGLPVPPDALTSYYQSEVDVLRTPEGRIRAYSHYIFDDRTNESGGWTATAWVTGGTGIYRDATGWIVSIAKDPTMAVFAVYGRICGPRIPG